MQKQSMAILPEITGYQAKHAYVSPDGVPSVVFQMDCMDLLAQLSDKSIDLAVVDPPYGTGWDGEVPSMVKHGKIGTNGWTKKASGYSRKQWDKLPPHEYFIELFRCSKKQIIWGGNYFQLPPTSGYIFWDKLTGDFSLGDGELAWTNVTGAVRKFTYRWAGFLKGPNGNVREKRIHPTQKPIALYDWIYKNYAQPNQIIIDTHLGSQSSRIAAHKAGLPFIACEMDGDYFKDGCKRFDDFVKQLRLF